MDIVCPHYPPDFPFDLTESHIIYQVTNYIPDGLIHQNYVLLSDYIFLPEIIDRLPFLTKFVKAVEMNEIRISKYLFCVQLMSRIF